MKIYQLFNREGYESGLYTTERTDVEKISTDFNNAFETAKFANETDDAFDGDIQQYADNLLEKVGITRIWADSVNTNVI